jgi:hypothetical protein
VLQTQRFSNPEGFGKFYKARVRALVQRRDKNSARALLLAIDTEARHLTALILQEMRKILSGSVPKTGTG